jgi:hypothetical protein
MMGKVLSHRYGPEDPSETARFSQASELYLELSNLSRRILDEAASAPDYLTLAAPLAFNLNALCALCQIYSFPSNCSRVTATPTTESSEMQAQAVEGVKSVCRSISDLVDRVNESTQLPQDLGRVSPIIMGAMYKAATTYAWLVRESGDESSQLALEAIRHCLRRLGSRWRNAAEYLRLLEAQEFTYAVGSASS